MSGEYSPTLNFEKTVGVRGDLGCIIIDVLKFCLMTKYKQSEDFRRELEPEPWPFLRGRPDCILQEDG